MAIKANTSKAKVPATMAPKKTAPVKAISSRTASKPAAKAAKPVAPTTVTLKHLAASLAERHELAKKQADAIVLDVFSGLVDHLKAGSRVRIGGLGIIEVKSRPARMGRNPATGEAIQIKASKKIAFRAAKDLKDAI